MHRWLIVVALAACHDKDAPPPSPKAAPAPTAPAPAPTPVARPVPVLPGDAPIDPRSLPPAEGFAAEEPDSAWKSATEKTLRARLAKLPGAKIECKQTLCEIAVGVNGMTAVDQLQQLNDIAQSVTLTQTGGELRAYLRFDRPEN
jgi:hypothetical protein